MHSTSEVLLRWNTVGLMSRRPPEQQRTMVLATNGIPLILILDSARHETKIFNVKSPDEDLRAALRSLVDNDSRGVAECHNDD